MMKKRIEPIEIQDPAIQEIQRKKSCFGRSCSLGCFVFLLLIIAIFLLIRFSAVARPKEVKNIPDAFPQAVPIYDKDAMTKITFVSGKKKERAVQTAAKLPDMIATRLIRIIDGNVNKNQPEGLPSTWNEFLYLLEHDLNDDRDTVTIQWKDLIAEPKFIQDFYRTNLRRSGFSVTSTVNDDRTVWELQFSKDKTEGTLFITDTPSKTGTDDFTLTTLFPAP